MIASAPLFLWLLPLAGLPVVFHLFMRVRKRRHTFSTLMFFHMIDPRLNARRRIKELLVLLLRVLFIIFLLLALARITRPGTGAGGPVAVVIVLDNSGSMGAPGPDGRPKLDHAVRSASALLSTLTEGDSAGLVLLVDDPVVSIPDGLDSAGAVKSVLSAAGRTEAEGSASKALTRAFELLSSSRLPGAEIHIFSDLHANAWNRLSGATVGSQGTAGIIVHRIPSALPKDANISVAGIRLPRQSIITGRGFSVGVQLENADSDDAEARMNVFDSFGGSRVKSARMVAESEKEVSVRLLPDKTGIHWVTAYIEGDALDIDNRSSSAFVCGADQTAVFAGGRNDYGLLPLALAPSSNGILSGIAPVFVAPDELSARLATEPPALVTLTWDALCGASSSDQDGLERFVKGGGVLLAVPAAAGGGDAGIPPEWIGAAPGSVAAMSAGEDVIVFHKGSPVFDDLRSADGDIALGQVKAFRLQPLSIAGDSTALLGLSDGRIVLASRRLGDGLIYACGLALDSEWSNLPLKPGFLALAQNLALSGQADHGQAVQLLIAGERVRQVGPGDAPARIISIAGSALDWTGGSGGLPILPRAGVYSMQTGTSETIIAVSSAIAEARREFIEGPKVNALEGLSYSVSQGADIGDVLKTALLARSGISLYPYFLLLAFLAFFLEGWAANRTRSEIAGG